MRLRRTRYGARRRHARCARPGVPFRRPNPPRARCARTTRTRCFAGTHLIAVADGVGGNVGGEVASRTVIDSISYLDDDLVVPDMAKDLLDAVGWANVRVADAVERDQPLQGMASTLDGAAVATRHRWASRTSATPAPTCAHDGALRRLTRDDSLVQDLVDGGDITAEQARVHPQRSVIMQAIAGGRIRPTCRARRRATGRPLPGLHGRSDRRRRRGRARRPARAAHARRVRGRARGTRSRRRRAGQRHRSCSATSTRRATRVRTSRRTDRVTNMQLDGITALVTGGASGLGLASAQRLAAEGAHVVVVDLPSSNGAQVASDLGGTFAAADVTQRRRRVRRGRRGRGGRPAARARALRRHRQRRAVGEQGRQSRLARGLHEGRHGQPDRHVQRAAAGGGEHGDQRAGRGRRARCVRADRVVAAFEGQIGQAGYASSKAGVAGLTIVAARDLARARIRVCTIAPGIMDTPMLAGLRDDIRESLAATVPNPSRLGDTAEFADLAATHPAQRRTSTARRSVSTARSAWRRADPSRRLLPASRWRLLPASRRQLLPASRRRFSPLVLAWALPNRPRAGKPCALSPLVLAWALPNRLRAGKPPVPRWCSLGPSLTGYARGRPPRPLPAGARLGPP